MRKKWKMFGVCLALAGSILMTGCGSGEDSSSVSEEAEKTVEESAEKEEGTTETASSESSEEDVTINVWTWEPIENQQPTIDEFNKVYPNIHVEFTMVDSEDMVTKLQLALASNSQLPDVAWLEIAQRGKLVSLDCWEDLSAEPYNVDKGRLLDWLIPISTNERGELVGIESSPAGAGLVYKRDLAKEYLGTDDQKELEKMLATWDDVIRVGKEVRAKNSDIYMFTGIPDVKQIVAGQNKNPFIVDGKLDLENSLGDAMQVLIDVKNADICDTMEQWSPAWNASFTEKNHIFYPCPTWGLTWMVKANDPDGANVWGAMQAPDGGYTWGGTIQAIPKDAEHKDAAFKFLEWNYLTMEGAKVNRDVNEYYTALKEGYEDPGFYSNPDEYYAGQDAMGVFANEILPFIENVRRICEYDLEINDAIALVTNELNTAKDASGFTVESMLEEMKQEIVNQVPELAE